MGSLPPEKARPRIRTTGHLQSTYLTWAKLQYLLKEGTLEINGHDLDISTVVAVARYGCKPVISKRADIVDRMTQSQAVLRAHVDQGSQIYGVNTGFGGNADARTTDLVNLQRALVQHQHSAILTSFDTASTGHDPGESHAHAMPTSWVRGAMLARCNTNIRGHSAIAWHVVDTLAEFIRRDLTPVVPLRGSISASGDLMPLSYIAGALQGNPDIFVRTGKSHNYQIVNARQALKHTDSDYASKAGANPSGPTQYSPIILGPKEGLALVNGTAPSAAVAALALYEVDQLAVLSQFITCLSSEALGGNVEWAHPFLAEIRPHPGQAEVSQNFQRIFRGSRLVQGLTRPDRTQPGLIQDRYSVRTAPQWIGPQLEDLCLAAQQLTTELNSTTDNPVVDVDSMDVHCGGNFQAASVTMAAEKMRLGLQMIGKMLFAQTGELLNPALSNGLPPNLASDDPSVSFCLKGVDINMAAYQSELAFLANPVSSHVQSAEMHNQAINSLALISARYTMQSVEIVSMMAASAMYAGLQAVDVRVLHSTFLTRFRPSFTAVADQCLKTHLDASVFANMQAAMWDELTAAWYGNAASDLTDRCHKSAKAMLGAMVSHACHNDVHSTNAHTLPAFHACQSEVRQRMEREFREHRDSFYASPPTELYMGRGTQTLYQYVRGTLGVPFHRGLSEDPISNGDIDGRPTKTVGSWISIIYEALRDGKLPGHLLASLDDVVEDLESM